MKSALGGRDRAARLVVIFLAFALAGAQSSPGGAQGGGSSATGSGHVAVWDGVPYWDNYTFTARTRADGSVGGRVSYFDKEVGYRANGDVYNLVVAGNKAKIGFQVQRGADEAFAQGFFVVVDGGEGGGGGCCDSISWLVSVEANGYFTAPDGAQTSLAEFEAMTPDQFVAWEAGVKDVSGQPLLAPQLFTYVNGNVQVR